MWRWAGCVTAFLAGGALLSGALGPKDEDKVVGLIDNAEVTAAEYQWFQEQEKAAVFQHFRIRYKLEYGPGYWGKEYSGETPRTVLKRRTAESLARVKVSQLLFKELGLIRDTGYTWFLSEFKHFNEDRAAALRRGEPIYGPAQYSQLQFYGYWESKTALAARQKLAAGEWKVTEALLREHYERNREAFGTGEKWTLEVAAIRPANSSQDSGSCKAAAARLMKDMNSGKRLSEAIRLCDVSGVVISQQRLEAVNRDRMAENWAGVEGTEKLSKLEPGSVVALKNGRGTDVVRCVAKAHQSVRSFEEAQDLVRERVLEQKYRELIESRARRAKVQIDEAAVEPLLP